MRIEHSVWGQSNVTELPHPTLQCTLCRGVADGSPRAELWAPEEVGNDLITPLQPSLAPVQEPLIGI